MKTLIATALNRSRTVLMILVLILVSGMVTYFTIPRESNPDITIPVIYVSVSYEGISPEDAERLLVLPLEKELRSLDGLKEMSATAAQSFASVTLEFVAGLDSDTVLANVRDKVNVAKAKLPADAEEPVVKQISFANLHPVVTAVLSGNLSEQALIRIARQWKDILEAQKEVLEVDIAGDREEVVDVILNPLQLESYGLVAADVVNLVSQNNQLVAAGNIDNGRGRFAIKVPAVYNTPLDILQQPVKVVDGNVITFGDIATLRSTFKEGGGYARMNGQASVALEVKKRPGENVINTVALVRELIAAEMTHVPNTLKVDFIGDDSIDIKTMVKDLQNSVMASIILVVMVIIGALGFRSALLSGIAIPGSFLVGLLIIAMMGLTLNMIVLVALMIAVGMLVDGVIVVTEYADRKMGEGMDRRSAYAEAATRMAWPIISSTATTLAAFFPLLFWPGIMGEMMAYLPLTLIATLSASLLMALVFIPTIGAKIGKPLTLSAAQQAQLLQAEQGDIYTLSGWIGCYISVLIWSVRRPFKLLLGGLLVVVAIYSAFAQFGRGVEFFPDVDTNTITVEVKVNSSNLAIDEKNQLLKQVESVLLTQPAIKHLYARSGDNDEVGTIRLFLHDWQFRQRTATIVEEIEQSLAPFAGLNISVERRKGGPPQGKPLELIVGARELPVLHNAVRQIKTLLAELDVLVNIEDDGPTQGYEWKAVVDREDAARYDADVSQTGGLIRLVTSGMKVGSYRPDSSKDEVDIRIRFPEQDRHLDSVAQLRLMSRSGLVPISNFTQLAIEPKVDSIQHIDGFRAITISANMAEGVLFNDILPDLKQALAQLPLDDQVRLLFKGQNEDQQESGQFLVKAFGVALFIMAIILVTQFNSFYQALLIMSAVILSTGGVFLGLLVTNQAFGIVMSGIGVIALAGIVVNNNIVLIDTFNVLRQQNMSLEEAILRTGAQRLRPVLLTTVTTILGLLPMVFSANIDLFTHTVEIGGPTAQWWSQLSIAIAGGLAFATLLTLVLTPCLLILGERFIRHD